MKITAAVTPAQSQPFKLQELTLDDPQPTEVLVKIVATGMCHTDLVVRDQFYPVPLPAVLGHEGAGVVESVGSMVTKVRPGDSVVLSYKACSHCSSCLEGYPGYCLDFFGQNLGMSRADGSKTLASDGEPVNGCFFGQSSFATYALAYEDNVVKVDTDTPLELLGPLGCGIQTGAGAVMNSLQPRAGSSIAVFGTGSVGLSAIMAANAVGCGTIIAVDLQESRLNKAMEVGATHTVNGGTEDSVAVIQELTGGGVDFSLEATANPQVLRQAVDSLAIRGICGVIGAAPLGTEVSLDTNSIMFGRTVRGIMEGDSVPDVFIPRLIDLYSQGRFPFDSLVKYYDLADINQAAEDSESGDVIKPILRMPH